MAEQTTKDKNKEQEYLNREEYGNTAKKVLSDHGGEKRETRVRISEIPEVIITDENPEKRVKRVKISEVPEVIITDENPEKREKGVKISEIPEVIITDENPESTRVAQVPSFYIGKPLLDYDAGIKKRHRSVPHKHTFLVVSRRGKSHADHVYRFNKANSLGLFGPLNPIRQLATRVVTNRYFESLVILTILVNCVFLALERPPEEAEYVFSGIYTMEMLLKILSRGLVFHTYAYLRDGWNWLDFIVVVLGYITMAPNIANFTGIRTIRVLRALRTISALKGLRAVVNTLLASLKLLTDVLVLFAFFLGVMALIGLQLFSGELRNKCVLNIQGTNISVNLQEQSLNESFWFIRDDDPLICGNTSTAGSCPSNYTCMANAGPNPDHGYTTFDNMGSSLIMALQILTMDFWDNIYNKIIRSSGWPYVFYFVIGIFFCAFYLMNLVLAMVYLSYEELSSVEKEREKSDHQRRTAASYPAGEETLKCLTLLDGSSPPPSKADTNDTSNTAAGSSSNERAEKRHESRHHVLTACILRKRSWMSKITCNAFLDVKSFLKRVRKCMHDITSHSTFDAVTVTLIVLNTIVLALYYHGIHPQFRNVLDNVNLAFVVLFAAEILFRLVAMGPMLFIRSSWNVFDTTVVLASLLGYCISTKGLSTFRTLRMVRVLCLAKSWKTMRRLIKAIGRSLGPVGNITIILGVVMYIFAVLGMKVFGKNYTADKFGDTGVPRWNFSDIWHAFMMVLRVLCGEWIQPLWDCMRVTSAAIAIPFFLTVLVIGNFLVLNLFVALMVNAFDFRETDENSNDNVLSVDGTPRSSIKKKLFQTRKSPLFVANCRKPFCFYKLEVLESTRRSDRSNGDLLAICEAEHPHKESSDITGKVSESVIDMENPNATTNDDTILENGSNSSSSDTQIIGCKIDREDGSIAENGAGTSTPVSSSDTMEINVDDCLPEYCACVDCPLWKHLSTHNFCWLKFRGRVRVFVEKKYFEWFILATVFLSSFTLVFEDVNLHKKPTLEKTLEILNYVFAAIFTLEFILKAIGLGLTKYFSSPWNCLDAFIVSISLACVTENKNLSVFRSLRTLRALRPLRAISRLKGMKVVVNALFAAIPGIGNVLLVSFLFWLVFSILGVHLFAGKFYKCVDKNQEQFSASVVASKAECLNHTSDGYRWVNSKVTFDNVLAGFLALIQMATYAGWIEIMKDAVDSTDVDMQPKFEKKMEAYLFFVAFIVVGSFFVLNLFVGVIIDNFNALKKKYEDIGTMGMLLTDSQRKWVTFLKEAARKKPPATEIRPQKGVRGLLYGVVTGDKFEIVIMIVIVWNMIMMMIQHHGQSPQVSSVLRMANFVFTGIFLLEAIVKIIALKLCYFKKAWNVFDFIIVVSSLVDVILDLLNEKNPVHPSLLRVLRIFRIVRLLRLVQFAKGIRQLLWALMISLPALFNVGTLLFLVIFIYAIIGMSMFGHVKQEGTLNDIVNFETFGSSLLLLFRLSTGAGWNDILDALLIKPPDCDPSYLNLPNGNCGSFGAVIYMVSYVIIVFLVIINMYIAIILENVNHVHEIEDFCISQENFDSYYDSWGAFVPDGKPYLSLDELTYFVASLQKPFRIPQPNANVLRDMKIPVMQGERIYCFDLLKALVRRVLEEHGESREVFQNITVNMEARFNKSFKVRKQSTVGFTSTHLLDTDP